MKETHIIEFLKQFSVDDLVSRGILRKNARELNNGSVYPLMELMASQGVTRLESPERDWFLTVDGEFQNPRSSEETTGRVENLGNPGNVFNYQNTSINPWYAGSTGPESDPEGNAEELSFDLERDLQKALRSNIQQLEPGLRITDGGVERTVEAGRIDITAEDSDGRLVLIELKRRKASLASIGQLLSYMGSPDNDSNRPVRGILVANSFGPGVVMAAKAVPNLSLRAYSFQFSFREP